MGEERAEELRTAVGDFLKAEAGTAGPVAGIAGPAADNVAVVAGEIAGPKELERAVLLTEAVLLEKYLHISQASKQPGDLGGDSLVSVPCT